MSWVRVWVDERRRAAAQARLQAQEAQEEAKAATLEVRRAKVEEVARAQVEAAEAKLTAGETQEWWLARAKRAARAQRAVQREDWQPEEKELAAEKVEEEVRLLQRAVAAARANRKDEYERWLNSLGYTPADDERTSDFATYFAKSVPDIQMPNRPTSSQLCISCSGIPIGESLESSRFEYP